LEDLYRAVYGEAWRDHTRFAWYVDRPLAEAGSSLAVIGDKIVAAQPFCDFPLHTPWGVERVTLFLDVVTHPNIAVRGSSGVSWRQPVRPLLSAVRVSL
jgi:hypothetical protein